MKSILVGLFLQFLVDLLRDAADRTSTTIDDDLVDTIEENIEELNRIASEKL